MNESIENDDRRAVVMTEIMTPNLVNFHGNVHGGDLLKMLDRVAYTCATRFSGKAVVTLSVDQVFFKEPLHVGELVTFYARVNYAGKTSMEIGIRVVAENIFTRVKRHTNTCFFTMVALDESGRPTSIPELTLTNEIEKRRFEEAKLRREARLAKSKKS